MKQIEDDLFECVKKLVENRIGLCIRQADEDSFRKILHARMKKSNISGPEEYLSFIGSDTEESKKEWKALILLITTGESYFFRDKGHFFLLQNTILPELINNRQAQRNLRIWSSGCSTGEEPYSISILLDMLLPDLKEWDIFILGTDINEESLKKAEHGIYSDWSFRMVDRDIQKKYFTRHRDEWEIDKDIREMVTFKYGNLMDFSFFSQNPDISNMDIIICRNVFIYFKKDAVSSVFNKFIEILKDDGYLITGHGELYGHNLVKLDQIMYPEAVIYRKQAAPKAQAPEIIRFQEHINEKAGLKIKVKKISEPVMPAPVKKLEKRQDTKTRIAEFIKQGRYREALDAEKNLYTCSEKHDMVYLIALAYANSGDYEKAENVCKGVMNIDANSAEPYFLLAHIAETRGNDEEAMNLLKKAIYLNPAFIAAYCELGGLYEKKNDPMRAKKSRTTAIELLKSLPSQSPVKPYDITAGELLKYVQYLIGQDDRLIVKVREGKTSR